MRLLLVWPSAEFSTYDCAVGIRAGLVAEGHEVCDYRLYNRIKLMSHAYKALAPEDREPALDMVCLQASEGLPYAAITQRTPWVLAVSGMGLHPNALWALRQIRVRIALWLTEAPYDTVEDRELGLARLADVCLVNERTAVDSVQATLDEAGNGGQAIYLRHAYNPATHQPGEANPADACDVLLVGTGFRERQWILEATDWVGIDLRLGGLWPGLLAPSRLLPTLRYPCMDNRDVARLYAGAKLVLNIHRWAPGAESANPRTWEAAACGAFQVADYRAEIADVLGDAVPMWRAGVPWQLAALVRRYLADDVGRQRLASLAQERVRAETFQARARQIVEAIQAHRRIRRVA